MGRRLNIVLLATIAVAAMLQSSSAQTVHVVGDSLGWVIPPGGSATYATWAARQTFRVGDTLVFTFSSGAHNVGRVTKANFDSCNTTNPILLLSNSPANVTLNETGEHYFLCAVPGHCAAGQKLAVNVTAATSSPAPQPSSPAPQPSVSPVSPPQAASPTPTPAPAPSSPTASPPSPSPSSSSPAPSTATPPSITTPSPPTSPSPTGDNGDTPPTPGNSATSLGVTTGLSVTLLSLIVALFM